MGHLMEASRSEQIDPYRQMIKTGSILMVTMGITNLLSLALRILIPRTFGPEKLGLFYFAESFATIFLNFLPLGLSVYINRAIPPDHEHSKKALTSILCVELLAGLILGSIYGFALLLKGSNWETNQISIIVGVYVAASILLRQILQRVFIALELVKITSMLNIFIRVYLLASCVLVIYFKPTIKWIALMHASSEILGIAVLLFIAWHRGMLTSSPDLSLVVTMLKISLPFCFVTALMSFYSDGNTLIMSAFASEKEIGLYGSAMRLTGIFLIFIPVIQTAITPVLSRALAFNDGSFETIIRTTLNTMLIGIFPFCMFLVFFGDILGLLVLGDSFTASGRILVASAPMMAVTFLNSILGGSLSLSLSGTRLSLVYFASIPISMGLNSFLIPLGLKIVGDGGAGVGAVSSLFFAEVAMLLALDALTPERLVDKKIIVGLLLLAMPSWMVVCFYPTLSHLNLWLKSALFLLSIPYAFLVKITTPREIFQLFLFMKKFRSA